MSDWTDRENFGGVRVGVLAFLKRLLWLFAPPPEAPEVVLDQERGVELADGDLVVTGRRHDLV